MAGTWSLRARLLAIAFAASATAFASGGAAMYWAAAREADRMADARLEELARTVLRFAEHELMEIAEKQGTPAEHTATPTTLGDRYRYQIWSKGQVVLRSMNAPAAQAMAILGAPGFATTEASGTTMRVFTHAGDDSGMTIQVAERMDARGQALVSFGGYLLALMLASIGAVALLAWVLLRLVLRPMDRVAAELSRRGPADSAPIVQPHPPAELVPMIDALNRLLARFSQAMAIQREFIATAAHELRSPLAGLRTNAQVARRARTDAERHASLQAIMSGVDRTAHLQEQLLDLARVDGLALEPGRPAMQLVLFERVMRDVQHDVAHEAALRGAIVRTEFGASAVLGVEFGVQMLLRNLVRNAIAHAPRASSVVVSTRHDHDGATVLMVEDSGPGIALHEREKVFERFYRGASQHVAGVGLGLSIVQAIAQAHDAHVHLDDAPGGGLRVSVRFPPSAEADQRASPSSSAGVELRATASTG